MPQDLQLIDTITGEALKARALARIALANADQTDAEACAVLGMLLESVQKIEQAAAGVR